jgi:polysaccharide export outer membrane protein
VDIKQVMLGHAPDPVLQADDILFLPTNAMKAAISSGGPGVLLELASVMLIAIYH